MLNEHYYKHQPSDLDTFTQAREKERKKKEKEEKKDCWETFLFDISCWLNIANILKWKEKKELFLKSHHYLFGHRILKFCYILNAPSCWNLLVVFFPLSIWLLLHVPCLHLIPLSLNLAKHLIASLKHYKRILEICL